MNLSLVLVGFLAIWMKDVSARPGHFLYSLPGPASQTTVLRDALGNQATSYAYHDGHSSSVSVSRNDVSKHLQYIPVPAVAPVVYEQPLVAETPYHYAAPAAYHVPDNYYYY